MKVIRALAVLALSLLAAPPSGSEESKPHELTAEDVGAWLDGLIRYGLQSGDIAGGEVAVVKDGRVLFQSGYGYADVASHTRMDPERVLMRIGSTSKLFTWTAVMQLVEQGKLDLNRNVDDYLDFKVSPPGGRPITLTDLMNHMGGFEEGLKDLLSMNPQGLQSTETYLKQHPRPHLFLPGTVPAYSNYGTALAGYIVQRVSGEPFERYIERHIFLPLGMTHSTFDQPLPARFEGQVSRGYRLASQPAQPFELVVTRPAGSVSSTASDMARFMIAHLQGGQLDGYRMLSPQTEKLMQTPSRASLPGFTTMAHGFFHEIRNGRTLVGHGGDTIFFHTELDMLPAEGVGIFYSFNSRGRDNAVYGLRKDLLDQFIDRYYPAQAGSTTAPGAPAAIATAAEDAQAIAGRYESSRRVEHGFLSVFYLLQQSVITANPDGTIAAPKAFEPGESLFHEVAPGLWRETGGTRALALREVNGLKTVIDSEDPTSVLQQVPLRRSASLNMTVLLGSLVVLAVAVIAWPIIGLVRRHYARAPHAPQSRRLRRNLRIAAVVDLVWLTCWAVVLTPVANTQLDFYSSALDPVIRGLQFGGLIAVAAAVLGGWSCWRLWQLESSWAVRLGNAGIAAALAGLVWIGVMGGLIGFNLNY